MPKPFQAWQREATLRYLTNPAFHARVQYAVQLTEATAMRMGEPLTYDQKRSVLQAATYGALVAEMPEDEFLSGWTMEEVEENMRKTADALGFTLGRQLLGEEEA